MMGLEKVSGFFQRSPQPLSATSVAGGEKAPQNTKASAPGLVGDQLVLSSRSKLGAGPAVFRYAGTEFPDLGAARSWNPGKDGLSGIEANRVITRTYHDLDQAFSKYLGSPVLPNWLTFAKYASHQAGVQIADLEAALMAFSADVGGIERALSSIKDAERREQALAFVSGEVGHFRKQLAREDGMWNVEAQADIFSNLKGKFDKLHDALVLGNVGVYEDILPVFDRFMKAEAAGTDGVELLRRDGYGKAPKDPHGLVLQAFSLYQEASKLSQMAAGPATNTTPEALLNRRKELVHQANLLLVTNEQMTVVQSPEIFGDADVARMTEAMSGKMSIVDAKGVHPLLPHGGNWTDFETRMGFEEVPAGKHPDAIRLTDHQGKVHHYVPAKGDRLDGTILSYFNDNLNGDVGIRKMISSLPEPVAPITRRSAPVAIK